MVSVKWQRSEGYEASQSEEDLPALEAGVRHLEEEDKQ